VHPPIGWNPWQQLIEAGFSRDLPYRVAVYSQANATVDLGQIDYRRDVQSILHIA
jgi:hypothetical protein